MKTLLAILALATCLPAIAGNVRIGWNPQPDANDFRIIRSEDGGKTQVQLGMVEDAKPGVIDGRSTIVHELDLDPGTYTIYVQARSEEGVDSPLSGPITITVPQTPSGVRIIITIGIQVEPGE